jgi:hypothetical protein
MFLFKKIHFFYKIASNYNIGEWSKLKYIDDRWQLAAERWDDYCYANGLISDYYGYKGFLRWSKNKSGKTKITIPAIKSAINIVIDFGGNMSEKVNKNIFNYNLWKEEIGKIESGGNYNAVNKTTNALGKYQFLPRYWWSKIKEFGKSKGLEVNEYKDYLENPDLQEDFMKNYTDKTLKNGLSQIRKMQDNKYQKAINLSDGQILALIHFQGLGGAKKWLETGDMIGAENNISVEKYLSKIS